MGTALPLAGIHILDIGTRIAAPFAATLLGDFGAEVIKVELPGTGDFMRTIGPFSDGYSLWWAVEGRNKKSITLDLRKPRGQDLFRRLVALTDVVVENFQPGTLEEWGLGYGALAAINPNVILTRASVYGQSGPYRDRPGLDRNGIGFGGLLYLTGYCERPPVRPGIIISDYLTGVFNAFAIMLAGPLYRRPTEWTTLSRFAAALGVGLVSLLLIVRFISRTFPRTGNPSFTMGTKDIGQVFFNELMLPFELISLLIVVAILGAIMLALFSRGDQ